MTRTLATLAALALTIPAIGAHAETISIPYDDLDLSSPQGQQTLAVRIDRAARQVCGLDGVETGTRIRTPQNRACYKEAKAKATQQFAAVARQQAKGG